MREHLRLGTDLEQRIDIFDIIERAGIWLMFQPLKDLYGGYERVGDAAGIIINAKHPLSLQRYTAAHEYGHHVLGHKSSIDDAERIQATRQRLDPSEVAAQTFAAHFLMPLQLVNTVLRRMGLPLRPGQLSPHQAYLLSLDLGASYSAAVNHLATLGKITGEAAGELRRQPPKTTKAEIGRGVRPQDVWSDAWPLKEYDKGRVMYPRVNDELYISLPEMPSTGYVWTVAGPSVVDLSTAETTEKPADGACLGLISDEFEPRAELEGKGRLGTGGVRHLAFRVLRPGRHTLELVKRRPWQRTAAPVDTFEVELDVSPKRTGSSDQGLSERQKPLVALAA